MHPVTIYRYSGSLSAIEFGPPESQLENFLVFVGGLGDGFLTVPYVPQLAKAVQEAFHGKWVVVQALISSSYIGFGTSSLEKDCKEIGKLVKYLREKRGTKKSKVVLMGHSTGCQDTMQYLTKFSKKDNFDESMAIQAGILQAPVSDSEAFRMSDDDPVLNQLLERARDLIAQGKSNEILPAAAMKYSFGSPINAYRFNSLISERGDDDFFSSYLTSEDWDHSFGKIDKPLLVLYSGSDEFVPEHVDKESLIKNWCGHCSTYWSEQSKIIKGASHNLGNNSSVGAVDEVCDSVVAFINDAFEV